MDCGIQSHEENATTGESSSLGSQLIVIKDMGIAWLKGAGFTTFRKYDFTNDPLSGVLIPEEKPSLLSGDDKNQTKAIGVSPINIPWDIEKTRTIMVPSIENMDELKFGNNVIDLEKDTDLERVRELISEPNKDAHLLLTMVGVFKGAKDLSRNKKKYIY
jgi:hypothetical protein